MYFLIIFLPFLNFILLGLFGRLIGRKGSILITYLILIILIILGIYLFYEIIFNNIIIILYISDWIKISNLSITFGLEFNNVTASMFLIIIIISSIVHIYSIDYMHKDPHLIRFISYLSLFTFFMLILITSNNFLQLFLGWEGVGLCSYLLINFWYTRFQANKSSLKALIVNKISDCFLLLGIILIFYYFKTLNFNIIFNLISYYVNVNIHIYNNIQINLIDLICILLFIGAIGKSAQLILHIWLPDAMEGPTPVSALIHAATMVTAGVFIIIKCNLLFYYSSINNFITLFGAFTALMSATIGLFQYDIKKVIAYSTCSQLGYMIFACGLNQYNLSLYHLVNHAFFKALLFLTAGSIIHSLCNIQDIRFMGSLLKKIPLSYLFFFIGSLSLSGFPFLTGYYSKDFIIELNLGYCKFNNILSFNIGYITAWLTILYSIRLIYYIFFGEETRVVNKKFWNKIHEMSYKTFYCLLILTIFTIFFGFFFRNIFIACDYNFINQDFSISKNYFNEISHEYSNNIFIYFINFIPSGIIIFIFIFYKLIMNYYSIITLLVFKNIKIFKFFINKWFFDNIYNIYISKFIIKNIAFNINKNLDKGFIEKIIGPGNIIKLLFYFNKLIKKHNNGKIYNYMIFYMNFILIILLYLYIIC